MTNRRHNKKRRRNVSEPSDINSLDGNTAPHDSTAQGRTHLGGSRLEADSYQAMSTSHQSPVNQALVNQSPVNQSLVNQLPVIQSPVNQSPVRILPVIQSPVNQSQVNQAPVNQALVNQSTVSFYQAPVTGHLIQITRYQSPGTGQFITSQQLQVIQSLVIGPHSSYPASISSHNSMGSNRRLAIHRNLGSEHSFAHELPNPATSS